MSGLSFSEAANALFASLALGVSIKPEQKPDTLMDTMMGSGVTVRSLTLINHIPSDEDGLIGCLFSAPDNTWIATLGRGYEAVILAADGVRVRLLEPGDLAGVTHAYGIYEHGRTQHVMPFLRQYKGWLFDVLGCGLIINLFGLCLPLFGSFVYDKILGNGVTQTLWALVIGLGIVIGVEFCLRILRIIIVERFSISAETDIDHATFKNLLGVKANALPRIGSFLEKYKQVLSYRDFLSSSYVLAFADLPFMLLFLAAITVVAGPLVFISIVCGLLMIAIGVGFIFPVMLYERQARHASERRLGLISDVLNAREAVIGSALNNELSRRWRQSSIAATSASSLARHWRNLGLTMVTSISYISYIGVLVGGVYMVENHTLTSGGLLAASMLTSRVMSSFSSVIMLVTRYREFRGAMRELNALVPPEPIDHLLLSRGKLRGDIRLDNISCRLSSGVHPVLANISLHVPAGQMVGIAGAPGAGKTTFLRLLTGVLSPDEGQILIDNIPLDKISAEDLTWNMGFKPQDFGLFDGTIEDNVRAGRPQLSAEIRHEVLESSGLWRSFQDSGLSWATDIGSRGMNLSGGQRQLVALARAFLNDPSLLILDEPSNGLDSDLEARLIHYLLQRKGKSTILVSTHSRNLLQACDRIIVIGQSRILADGPTDKILA